jgi:mRNA-degrading endonuclease toxin of MazEF toxin-antitoxin module
MSESPKRGEIYLVHLISKPKDPRNRPALVVSLDIRNKFAGDIIVVPLSTTLRQAPTHVLIKEGEGGLSKASMAKCEQVTTIDKALLIRGPFAGKISAGKMKEIEKALSLLSPEARAVVLMHGMDDLTFKEIAEISREPLDTVKTRIHRARLALRKVLNDGLRTRRAPEPEYDRQLCLDLLGAKLEAMDSGRAFPIGRDVMCERCRSIFAELDLGQNSCAQLLEKIPAEVRKRIEKAIAQSVLSA